MGAEAEAGGEGRGAGTGVDVVVAAAALRAAAAAAAAGTSTLTTAKIEIPRHWTQLRAGDAAPSASSLAGTAPHPAPPLSRRLADPPATSCAAEWSAFYADVLRRAVAEVPALWPLGTPGYAVVRDELDRLVLAGPADVALLELAAAVPRSGKPTAAAASSVVVEDLLVRLVTETPLAAFVPADPLAWPEVAQQLVALPDRLASSRHGAVPPTLQPRHVVRPPTQARRPSVLTHVRPIDVDLDRSVHVARLAEQALHMVHTDAHDDTAIRAAAHLLGKLITLGNTGARLSHPNPSPAGPPPLLTRPCGRPATQTCASLRWWRATRSGSRPPMRVTWTGC